MPPNGNRDAHEHAEEICDHVRRRLQELREARGKSRCALAQEAGVSRDMIGRIESRGSVPTVYLLAKVAFALETTVERLCGWRDAVEARTDARLVRLCLPGSQLCLTGSAK